MAPSIDEVAIADRPTAWEAVGFELESGQCVVGDVRIRLAGTGEGRGILGWSLRGVADASLDGLPTEVSDRPPPGRGPAHPNGVAAIDHVVAISPSLGRTVAALERGGLELRRIREEPTPAGAPRQAFFRLGAAVLEVVEEPEDVVGERGVGRPAFFWGLALLAPDIERTAAFLGDRVSAVRPAVQPGRRIATLRRSAGLSVPVALISPAPERRSSRRRAGG